MTRAGTRPARHSSAPTSPLARIGLLVAGALVLSASSWFVGTMAGDRDAQRPLTVPTASLLTARVEDRVVVTSLSGRAAVGYAEVTRVSGPVSGGRVTATPMAAGDAVEEGSVLVEVDGRPTLALVGDVPMYRPLVIDTEGPDVMALETSLARLGIDPGQVDGRFDATTERGVRELFRRSGYQPVEPTMEQRAAYSAAVEAATMAELAVIEGEHQLELDEAGLDPSDRAALDAAIADADAAVAKAERDAVALDAKADVVADERADASATVEAALRRASVARLELLDAMSSKDHDLLVEKLSVARASFLAARQRVADQATIVGAGLQTSEVVFFASLPRQVQSVEARTGDDATGELMKVSGGDLVGRWFVTSEERDQLRVGGAVTLTDGMSGAQVTGAVAEIATTPGDPTASSTTATPNVASAATAGDGGSAGSVGESSGGDHADEFLVTISIDRSSGAAVDDRLVDRDVQVSAPVSESAHGLAVPLAAVSSRPDGTVVVRKEVGDGDSVEVEVTVGARGDGVVRIDPTDATALAEGDRVVVGR